MAYIWLTCGVCRTYIHYIWLICGVCMTYLWLIYDLWSACARAHMPVCVRAGARARAGKVCRGWPWLQLSSAASSFAISCKTRPEINISFHPCTHVYCTCMYLHTVLVHACTHHCHRSLDTDIPFHLCTHVWHTSLQPCLHLVCICTHMCTCERKPGVPRLSFAASCRWRAGRRARVSPATSTDKRTRQWLVVIVTVISHHSGRYNSRHSSF